LPILLTDDDWFGGRWTGQLQLALAYVLRTVEPEIGTLVRPTK